MSGFETLLSPSGILVYGRVMQDIQIVATNYDAGAQQAGAPPRRGDNRFLQDQLQADGARFARIYAYAYEGCIYDLLRPVLLLVHGDGEPAEIYGQPAAGRDGPRRHRPRLRRLESHARQTPHQPATCAPNSSLILRSAPQGRVSTCLRRSEAASASRRQEDAASPRLLHAPHAPALTSTRGR